VTLIDAGDHVIMDLDQGSFNGVMFPLYVVPVFAKLLLEQLPLLVELSPPQRLCRRIWSTSKCFLESFI